MEPLSDTFKAIRMRRAITTLLLALFSFTLITPVLVANASALPDCCLRDGKHHCGMADMGDQPLSPSGKAWNGVAPKCPMYPRAGNVASDSQLVLHDNSPRLVAPSALRTKATNANESYSRIALRGSAQKRGPPPSLD